MEEEKMHHCVGFDLPMNEKFNGFAIEMEWEENFLHQWQRFREMVIYER